MLKMAGLHYRKVCVLLLPGPPNLAYICDKNELEVGLSQCVLGGSLLQQTNRMKVKSESEDAQSYPTLSDPMDCSLPGSSAMGFSR